ncbi:hypothetical protein Rsub_07170 [Raphidocelis subcapitata]|uniref:Coiled-coil domain-containing protein n=1 Tax=Raphidocelis subcapitata TaxID=307507 RepID=A0A2V0P8H0_9CHLO|nr:hypothetical protein Rsub_07170 [Raphidocelis subcapitata]|eukprot:GBF94183.1 hypothetical protein Rsub_07170 [Raphidocelis subcapitata]
MPKGLNEKALAARERKAATKEGKDKEEAKAKEDAFWREAGEGAKSKAQAKRDEEAARRAETAAKKAEAKRLADEEEAAISKPKPKPGKVAGPKVTHHELALTREADSAAAAEAARQRQLEARREVDEASYSRLVESENTNRQEDAVEARSMEAAIDALGSLSTSEPAVDKHPEKRMRAAWQAYEAANLPLLKMEKPGLKQSQYREMLWKQWQKAPENPVNAAAAAAARK